MDPENSSKLLSFVPRQQLKAPPLYHGVDQGQKTVYKIEDGMTEPGSALALIAQPQNQFEYLDKKEASALYRSNSFQKMNERNTVDEATQQSSEQEIQFKLTKMAESQGFKNILHQNIDDFEEGNFSDKDSPDDDDENDIEALGATSHSIHLDDSPEKDTLEKNEGLIGLKMTKQGSGGYSSCQVGNYNQPEFHQENKSICERLFSYFASSTDLKPDELAVYHTIKNEYAVKYDEKNGKHEVSGKSQINPPNPSSQFCLSPWSL